MSQPEVVIENLSFSYPDGTKALKNINLKVDKGEFLVIMGSNGAGKSTLCHSINGVIPSIITGTYKGSVNVLQKDVSKTPLYELSTLIGTVIQNSETQIFTSTVREEVTVGLEFLGVPRKEILERLDSALKTVRMDGMEERATTELSGGQKQRLVLASILAMRPRILLLDEPTSQLDPIGTEEVLSVIKDLKQKLSVTVIMVSHKSEEIVKLADRIIILNDGSIAAEGTPNEIMEKEELLKALDILPPQITRLGYKLKNLNLINKAPLTLEEGETLLRNLLGKYNFVSKIEALEHPNILNEADPLLEVRDLSYTYPGGVTALKNINLKIFPGEFVGIIGQNGSGKTTLVKHFVGLLRPTQGNVLIENENTRKFTVGELAKRVGLILQNPDHQLFAFTVKNEVEFGLKNLGYSEKEIKVRINEALKLVGLEKRKEIYPFNLSLSDRRKLTVAAVWAIHPKIFILDEPTTGQDYRGRYHITEIAKTLNKMGHTIVVISHDMELIASYVDRLIVLCEGEILLDAPAREVFKQEEVLAKTFLKPPQITQLALALNKYGFPQNILSTEELEVTQK